MTSDLGTTRKGAGIGEGPPGLMPGWADLVGLPTLYSGHDHDLRVEVVFPPAFAGVRVWLARGGLGDGHPFEDTVYVEVLEFIPGRPDWYDLGYYDAHNPTEGLGGYSVRDLLGDDEWWSR